MAVRDVLHRVLDRHALNWHPEVDAFAHVGAVKALAVPADILLARHFWPRRAQIGIALNQDVVAAQYLAQLTAAVHRQTARYVSAIDVLLRRRHQFVIAIGIPAPITLGWKRKVE